MSMNGLPLSSINHVYIIKYLAEQTLKLPIKPSEILDVVTAYDLCLPIKCITRKIVQGEWIILIPSTFRCPANSKLSVRSRLCSIISLPLEATSLPSLRSTIFLNVHV